MTESPLSYLGSREKSFNGKEPQEEVFHLSGRNILDLLDLEIDPSSNLLGDRWLTRDGCGFIISPSGHGKSSASIKVAISWAIGRIAFGINPARPLRIVVTQSEDDDADSKKFSQIIRKMKLTDKELELLKNNTRFEFRRDLTGDRFIKAVDAFLTEFPADLLIINPLSGFLLCDLKDDERVGEFLRNKLNAILVKHRCAVLIFHHTPKTNFTKLDNMQWYDWMYAMSGCAALTNWSRSVLVVAPSKVPGTYRFIAAKRFDEIEWTEREYWFAHSREILKDNGNEYEIIDWVPASQDQIASARPIERETRRTWTSDQVYKQMSPIEDYTRETFRGFCRKQCGRMGRDTSDEIRATLIKNGLVREFEGEGKGAAKNKIFRKTSTRTGGGLTCTCTATYLIRTSPYTCVRRFSVYGVRTRTDVYGTRAVHVKRYCETQNQIHLRPPKPQPSMAGSDIIELVLSPEQTDQIAPIVRAHVEHGRNCIFLATCAPTFVDCKCVWRFQICTVNRVTGSRIARLVRTEES
jgi:AAA domain